MSEIRCSNCSTMNREGAAFCRNCGAHLPQPVPRTVLAEEPQAAPPAASYSSPAPVPAYQPGQPQAAAPPDSRAWLRTSASLAAVLLGFVFILLVSFALPIINAAGDLLDGEQYKTSLREQEVYNRFPDLFAEQMQRSQATLGKEARIDFTGVSAADWKLIATELVTPLWMQSQVESLLDQSFNAAKSGAAPPELNISLAEVNQRLGGDAGFNIYKQIIATKRSCSLDDFFDILDWIGQEQGVNLPICNIPPDLTEFAAWIAGYDSGDELIRDLLKELPDAIPSDVSLSDFFSLRMDRVSGWLSLFTILAWISLLLGVGALLATLVSPLVRNLKGWLLVWGVCLAAVGLICLVVSQLMPYTLGGLIVGAFSSSLAPSISKIILETGRSVTEAGANRLFWQSLVLLLLGLAMAGTGSALWGVQKLRS